MPNANLLLVEGRDDRFVLAEVFEKATGREWEPVKGQYLVDIEPCGSDRELLDSIRVRWKESGRRIVGVVIDANGSGARWAQIRDNAPPDARPALPEDLPADGLLVDVGQGRRFGAWIMPDNGKQGMMETFLLRLRSSMPGPVGAHVVDAARRAQVLMNEHAASHPGERPPVRPWKDAHADKAELHTWLAWQDPPGLRLHEAVMRELLDVHAPLAQRFVAWMVRLYGL